MIARKYQRDAGKSNPHFRRWRKKTNYVLIAPKGMKTDKPS
jgi:hypothetical protein